MALDLDTQTLRSMSDFASPARPTAYNMASKDLVYDFCLVPKVGANKLYVFLPGALNRKRYTPPYFQRLRWFESMDAHGLVLTDPTLTRYSTLTLGWFQGTQENFAINELSNIVSGIADELSVSLTRTICFGSSAGGFGAMLLAANIKCAGAIVNNPQTNVLRYKEPEVKSMLKHVFRGISMQDAKSLHKDRLNAIEYFAANGRIPRIRYIQNTEDERHYNNHLVPFVEELRLLVGHRADGGQLDMSLYRDTAAGHNPAPIERILPEFREAERRWLD